MKKSRGKRVFKKQESYRMDLQSLWIDLLGKEQVYLEKVSWKQNILKTVKTNDCV